MCVCACVCVRVCVCVCMLVCMCVFSMYAHACTHTHTLLMLASLLAGHTQCCSIYMYTCMYNVMYTCIFLCVLLASFIEYRMYSVTVKYAIIGIGPYHYSVYDSMLIKSRYHYRSSVFPLRVHFLRVVHCSWLCSTAFFLPSS